MTTLGPERVVELQVDAFGLSDVDVEFNVRKDTTSKPNTAEITIYNLSEATRSQLGQKKDVFVELSAGYKDSVALIFKGNLRDVQNRREGPNYKTIVSGGDGESVHRRSRIRQQMPPGATVGQAIEALAGAMDVGVGNLQKVLPDLGFANGVKEFVKGTVLNGNAAREMTRLLRSAGKEWSVVDDELQILDIGTSRAGSAAVLNERSGLLGVPELSPKGILSCTTLIRPGIQPAAQVKVESAQIDGFFRVEVAEFTGATRGDDWFIDLECKEAA